MRVSDLPHFCAAFSILWTGACEEPAPPPPEPAPPAVEQRRAAAAAPVAWPSDVQALRPQLDAFTTVERCVEALRADTPTAVAEGITDLAYDRFFDDVCRGLAAVKGGAEEGCDALAVSTARAGCRRRLAIVHARPSACPEGRAIPGREPVCVAWAARDPDLCRAAREPVRCRAVLAGDEAACERLEPGDRERCRAHVRRYAPSLGGARRESPAAREPAVFTLTLEGDSTVSRDVLERGVRLVPEGCRFTVALADPRGDPSIGLAADRATFHLELAVPTGRPPIELSLGAGAALTVATPERDGLTSMGATGTVTVERFDPRRGGAIAGAFEGTLRLGDRDLPVRGRFSTFVRDLDPLPSHCARQ